MPPITSRFQGNAEHPFWVKRVGWKKCQGLDGLGVLDDKNDGDVHIAALTLNDESSKTFNLVIEASTRSTSSITESVRWCQRRSFRGGTMSSLTGGANVNDFFDAHEPLAQRWLRAIGYGNPAKRTFFGTIPQLP